MLDRLNSVLEGHSPALRFGTTVGFVAALGVVDYLTGYEVSFSIFYLIPVGIASWYGRPQMGRVLSVIAAATWLAVDLASGHPYSHPAIPFWNAVVRLGFFLITSTLLIRLRGALRVQAALADVDGLTGILNGRSFVARYNAIASLARRHRRSLAIGFVDLDDFKAINDTLGHSAGDKVLREVARVIAGRIRGSDSVARLGGDEFALLLETDLDGARTLMADVRAELLALAAEHDWPIGFSIGVAVFATPPADCDAAIKAADKLMYQVKASGKNDVFLEAYDQSGAEEDDFR